MGTTAERWFFGQKKRHQIRQTATRSRRPLPQKQNKKKTCGKPPREGRAGHSCFPPCFGKEIRQWFAPFFRADGCTQISIPRHLTPTSETCHPIPSYPIPHRDQPALVLWLSVLVDDGQQLHQRLIEVVLVLGPRQHHLVSRRRVILVDNRW